MQRLAIVLAVLVAGVAPSSVGALSVSTGNGRAETRERASVLPGEARTVARLLQLRLGGALDRGDLPVDLGQITAEAAKAGGLFSELVIEGLKLGAESVPTVAFHSDGDGQSQEQNDDLTVTVKDGALDSSLALANWSLRSAESTGAVSRLDLLSGTVTVPGVGLKANIGERGFISEVTKDRAHARFAITLENLAVTLDSVLPDVPLPLGTSLDLITRLELPLGETLNAGVVGVARLVEELDVVGETLADLDAAKTSLSELAADTPGVKAALDALTAAEAAVTKAGNDLVVATANVDAARIAADTADATAAAADATVAAAQQDVAGATAAVQTLQAQVAALDAEIAALQQELSTTLDPARLLALPGEIAARQAARTAAAGDLATAQTTLANANAVLGAAQTSAAVKRGAADAARATLTSAQSVAAAAATAVTDAQTALVAAQSGADAALAAAAVGDLALAALNEEITQLQQRLRAALQSVSDLLADLPPLPVLEQELDEALRSSAILSVGGLALETTVSADRNGSTNLVHCKVERVSVLGWSPDVEECTDLIAMEKEAVRRVNEVLHGLGAVGVDGVNVLGPGGTWSPPGPVGPDGKARSEGQMSALTLRIPEVRLGGMAANLLASVEPILRMITQRPAAAILVPQISPGVDKDLVALSMSGPTVDAGSTTLGDQLQQVTDELDKVDAPESLANLSTGSVDLVVAQAHTVAEYDTTRFGKKDTADPTAVCDGDPVCLAQCAAGQCPGAAGEDPTGAGVGGGGGSGSDHVGLPLSGDATGTKLPVTGPAGGLTAVAMLALGGAGARWVRRRPHP